MIEGRRERVDGGYELSLYTTGQDALVPLNKKVTPPMIHS